MTEEWNDVSFVISSKYRVAVLEQLAESPSTPSKIATDTDLSISHISRALRGLRGHELAELLVSEDRKKGRVYGLTERGEQIWHRIEAENLL